jgi:hypothetical protein
MKPSRLATLLALSLAAAAIVLGSTAAAGGPPPPGLSVAAEPTFDDTQPRFTVEILSADCLSDTVIDVIGVEGEVVDFSDPNNATVSLPVGTPGGEYLIEVSCSTDTGTRSGQAGIAFGNVIVDKVVEGAVPPGTEFVVVVECTGQAFTESGEGYGAEAGEGLGSTINETFVFPATGGTGFAVHYNAQDCTITETETGGAQSVDVATEDCEGNGLLSPAAEATTGDFFIGAPVDCVQTVTNTFPGADVADDDDDVVAATPTFTG